MSEQIMIVIDGHDSVPLVTINGQKIEGLVDVSFHWQTKDEKSEGFSQVLVEHVVVPDNASPYTDLRGWSRGNKRTK